MKTIGVAIIGCGGITLQNHLPGLALCPEARLAALCDANPAVLEKARLASGVAVCHTDYREILKRDDVQAVIVATPNFLHAPLAIAAAAAGKHVFCEKPLAMSFDEAKAMHDACESAGVRHMTAFTYRFVPAMRYLKHLVDQGDIGRPYHFRSCRLQDWGDRNLGWRQVGKLAGSGELGDMLSHRIDYSHLLFGPMARLVGRTRRFLDVRGGQPSDLDDWVAIMADFQNGATGLLESSKLATGRGESAHSQDYVEVNGSEGTVVYDTQNPGELRIARKGQSSLSTIPLPPEFRVWPGSPRDPSKGDPRFVFRYDQNFEFLDAIRAGRPCSPSFRDGALCQGVMDAALRADASAAWIDVSGLPGQLTSSSK